LPYWTAAGWDRSRANAAQGCHDEQRNLIALFGFFGHHALEHRGHFLANIGP
jgi:hypothetical protein